MRRSGSLFIASFLPFFLMAPSVSADIFKCTDRNGLAKYQNFACAIDSIGSAATASAPKEVFTKPTLQPVSTNALIPRAEEPNPGMSMTEVRAFWGVPKSTKVIKSIEIWYYDGPGGSTRGVRFDRGGTVLGVGDEDWKPDASAD